MTEDRNPPREGLQETSRGVWMAAAIMLAVDSVAAVAAPPINTWYLHTQRTGAQVPLESGAALIAVTTFIGICFIQRKRSSSDTLVDMRSAIAGSFILVYLVMVVWSAFFAYGNSGQLNVLSSTLITNFTVLAGIVIGFYFTTSAATSIAASRRGGKHEQEPAPFSPTLATPPSPASPATPASYTTPSPDGKPDATPTVDADQPLSHP
jgi:hypothetical protein